MAFIDKTVATIESREGVEKIIKESAMFFSRRGVFDVDPMVFQLENCLLDLHTNTFRLSFFYLF